MNTLDFALYWLVTLVFAGAALGCLHITYSFYRLPLCGFRRVFVVLFLSLAFQNAFCACLWNHCGVDCQPWLVLLSVTPTFLALVYFKRYVNKLRNAPHEEK